MAYSKSERYTLALTNQNEFRVPAVEQESQNLGYNDEVEVTLYPDNDIISSLTFEGFLTSANKVTIPASIRRRIGIDGESDETVTISVEATGESWSPEVGASARKAVYESAHPDETELKAVTNIVNADD